MMKKRRTRARKSLRGGVDNRARCESPRGGARARRRLSNHLARARFRRSRRRL